MKKRVFALFTAMFLLCGMLAGCGPTGSSSTTTDGSDDGAKDTLIVAIPESPTYMDPMVQASIGTYRVTTQMFDRLVMMDNDMNLVPGCSPSRMSGRTTRRLCSICVRASSSTTGRR